MANYVLTVEDDDGVRQLIDAILSREGYQVVGAPDGETALRLIAKRPPGLILLDMQLPGINGSEFLTKLLALTTRRVPVIVVTVDHSIRSSQEARTVDEVLIKPFAVDELTSTAAKYLSRG